MLHYEEDGETHVGYIANVHTQAFQGTDAVLLSQHTDILIFTSMFKEQKTQPGDVIDFDIICGDFNFDNMSPGNTIKYIWRTKTLDRIRLNNSKKIKV